MSYTPPQDLMTTAFGELSVAEVTPVIQAAAQYGLGSKTRTIASGTGASAGANGDSLFYCTSGTTANNFASVFSKRAVSYKSGQGLMGEFTAVFDTPVTGQEQRAGLITATDAYNFGYNGTAFGIYYIHHGQQEIRELQVTGAAGGSENATVQVDGNNYTVPLTTGTVQHNATEIADSLNGEAALALWEFQQIDDTVVARTITASVVSGAFSFTSATATATWSQVAAGAAPTETFIAQADWNGDSDPSQWTDITGDASPFDPKKGNVYKIQTQYLGFGNIFFWIECPCLGEFVLVHTLEYANAYTVPTVSNPTFRIGWVVGNNAGTTSMTLQGATYALFIEGKRVFTEPGHSQFNEKTGISTAITNLLSIKVREVFGTKVNLSSVIPKIISVSTDSAKGAVAYVNLNADVAGEQNWQYHDENESVVIYDTAGTTVTNGQNIFTELVPAVGALEIDIEKLNLEMNPNDTLTIAIQKLGASTHDAAASIIWQEDI